MVLAMALGFSFFAYSIDLQKVKDIHVFSGPIPWASKAEVPPTNQVAINANYFWGSKPIGLMVENGKALPCIESPKSKMRPIVAFTKYPAGGLTVEAMTRDRFKKADFAIEVGPYLIRDRLAVWSYCMKEGQFQDDVCQSRPQTFLASYGGNTLVVGVMPGSCAKLTEWGLAQGYDWMIKMDGGSSTFLEMRGDGHTGGATDFFYGDVKKSLTTGLYLAW